MTKAQLFEWIDKWNAENGDDLAFTHDAPGEVYFVVSRHREEAAREALKAALHIGLIVHVNSHRSAYR